MSTDQPGEAAEEPRRDDGLDLARQVARSTAGSALPAARRRSRGGSARRSGETSGRRGSGGWSGPRPDDRDPQLLGGELGRLVDRHGWELELRVRAVFHRWPELVGDEVAGHCTPESFSDGTLVVRTDSTAWATQLKLLLPTVLRRLNDELGAGTVTVVDVQGPHLPSWSKGRRSTRDSRGPCDTYG